MIELAPVGPDLGIVEAAVRHAVRTRDTSALRLLGNGEVSIVLGWPTEQPLCALKRVPPFRNAAAADGYIASCERFFSLLDDRGAALLPTAVEQLQRADGRVVVYHRQPIVDAAAIGHNVLRASTPASDHPLLDAIVDAAVKVVGPGVGLDCQAANWFWDGTTAAQIDVSSPFLIDATGKDLTFDTRPFLQEYPRLVRRYLKRELVGVVTRFTTVEGALGDLVANLIKEDLDQWVQPAIDAARERAGVELSRAASQKMLDDDTKLFPVALRLKRARRWWVTHTGRQYESLLPQASTFG